MVDIDEIFHNLQSLNEEISEQQLNFQNWLEDQQEQGVSDEEILEQVNSNWTSDPKTFKTIAEVEEWFDDLGI